MKRGRTLKCFNKKLNQTLHDTKETKVHVQAYYFLNNVVLGCMVEPNFCEF